MRAPFPLAVLVVALAACVSPPQPEPEDSGVLIDAGVRAVDAGFDAGVDAGESVVVDSGIFTAQTGVLIGGPGVWPGAMAGVKYVSGPLSGETDSNGTFQYSGSGVSFSVGDVTVGTVAGAPKITAWQLAGASCSRTEALDKVLVLLFSLDGDGDPSNGLRVSLADTAPRVTLASLSMSEITTRVSTLIPGRTALTAAAALDLFIRQVDDETWSQLPEVNSFSGAIALRRGQGIATDGTSWFFSGTASLERTDLQFNSQDSNNLAIPIALALAGSDHIGDIDVAGGTLYAPIEDGKKGYKNPKLVAFSAGSLSAGTTYSISNSLQTQGVPWVAVNAARNEAYFAEWDPTTQLNVFALDTMQFVRSLPFITKQPIGRVQGAKVFESALYLATDDAQKNVFKLDLETGTVLRLFSIDTTGEQEGLAFLLRPDGSRMHTLNVNASRNGSELRHHQRTRSSIRSEVCR